MISHEVCGQVMREWVAATGRAKLTEDEALLARLVEAAALTSPVSVAQARSDEEIALQIATELRVLAAPHGAVIAEKYKAQAAWLEEIADRARRYAMTTAAEADQVTSPLSERE